MGLSSDPVKRRRQLEALERGALSRAASLRASIDAIEDPSEAASEDPIEAAPAPTSVAEPGSRIVDGGFGELPSTAPAASDAAGEDPPAADPVEVVEEEAALVDVDEGGGEPGALTRFAAGALGVRRG